MLAEAVDGVARDDVCDRARQRGIVSFAVAVLTEVRAHLEREDAALYRLVVVSADEWAHLAPLHCAFAWHFVALRFQPSAVSRRPPKLNLCLH